MPCHTWASRAHLEGRRYAGTVLGPALDPPLGSTWAAPAATLAAGLALAAGLRIATWRPDDSTLVADPDILVLHVAGLRADAASGEWIAGELLGKDVPTWQFRNTFAGSSTATRSALSALRGSLALDLAVHPGPESLPVALAAAGYHTALLTDDPALLDAARGAFATSTRCLRADDFAVHARALRDQRPATAPALTFTHARFGEDPLHADTTEAWMLAERYPMRRRELALLLEGVLRASLRPGRPTLVAVLGATGLELGEHPSDPEAPYDSQLRVPFFLALLGGGGLPSGGTDALVAGYDLAPTLLDLVDAGSRPDTAMGLSHEGLIFGWEEGSPERVLMLAGPRHFALRSAAWKLIVPATEGRGFDAGLARLFALEEDPGERRDLLGGHEPGPLARAWLSQLRTRLDEAAP